ncbi:MAG: bifunctional [glutamine synthetase] adenylyltransferase/[glutamine synthetase]-adenylyl-L-tyrosine phosphorylase, partial [Alphaproteobacteria bacterium]
MHFLDLIKRTPLPFNGERAAELLTALLRSSAGDSVKAALAEPSGRLFLEGVFDGSPFLGHAAIMSPETLQAILIAGPDATFAKVIEDFRAVEEAPNLKLAMSQLRRTRLRSALTIGLADLSGAWTTMQATHALSVAASVAIEASLQWALKDAEKRNILMLPDKPKGHGIIILGMGKLGANELNYSSDIDLIILYDPDRMEFRRPDRLQHEIIRLTRSLVQLLDERTADGYVHRTDLRLRPDPASTPPAISIQAAEAYYESMGQNWERAAMIKARPVAGDITAGEQFLAELRPFIWRRSLDFNAIRDIQSIKRQIDHREGD